jgi:hypothetical protein
LDFHSHAHAKREWSCLTIFHSSKTHGA